MKRVMTYARARLLLGMSNVAFWVVLSVAGLWGDFSGFVNDIARCHHDLVTLGGFLLGYILLSLPFDIAGGYWLPAKYHGSQSSFVSWLGKWSRGVLMQGLFLLASGYLVLLAGREIGLLAAIVVVGINMLLMAHWQLPLARLISPLQVKKVEEWDTPNSPFGDARFVFARSEDLAFTGGVSGAPGREVIVMPDHWRKLSESELFDILRARRMGVIYTGSRTRGLILALLWNLLGFILAVMLSPEGLATAGGLVDTIFIFTLFSFIGLFGLLPELNRRGVFEADLWAHEQGACEFKLQRSFSETDRLQDNEPCRPRVVEFLCHPVPSVENRILNLFTLRPRKGAWHAARMMLFLSWAGMGLLSRSAICNIGRPELWVFLPCD